MCSMLILNVHAVICIHVIVIPGVIDGSTPTTSTITEVYTHGAVDYYIMHEHERQEQKNNTGEPCSVVSPLHWKWRARLSVEC